MRIPVVRVGNSRGIRIPKPLIEQCSIGEEVDLTVDDQKIVLKAIPSRKKRPRADWAESLRGMHSAGDDRLLLPDTIDAEMDDWAW